MQVLSGQIETDADIEVLDRNMHIATVGEGGKLNIEMRARSRTAATSARTATTTKTWPLGYIPIDSVHSPVRKVNFAVEAARLGQMTDYDKLDHRSLDQRRDLARRRNRPGLQAAERSHDDLHQLRGDRRSRRGARRARDRLR